MASTRTILDQIDAHVTESMGRRDTHAARPALSPIPVAKDIGRRTAHGFGRISIEQVIADPAQPRTAFDEASLGRLSESIRSQGQLHPIHVRWSDECQKWIIVSGERRWRACRLAGLSAIDCYFHERPLATPQILELQLIENLLRDDLNPLEEARAFRALLDQHGWTGKQLAESLHIPASKISRALALLDLPSDLRVQVENRTLPARTAYELTKLPDGALRKQLGRQAVAGKLTTVEAANCVRQTKRRRQNPRMGIKQTFYAENGWIVSVSSRVSGTYHHLEQALVEALDEVRLRIANNIHL